MRNRLETTPTTRMRRTLPKTIINKAMTRLRLEDRIRERFMDLDEWCDLSPEDRLEVVEECAIRILKLR